MKKTILSVIVMVSLFALCGETDNMNNQILWSTSWIAVLAVSGKLLSNIIKKEDETL